MFFPLLVYALCDLTFQAWCPILFLSVHFFLRVIFLVFLFSLTSQDALSLEKEKRQSQFIFVQTSPVQVVRFGRQKASGPHTLLVSKLPKTQGYDFNP